MAEAKEIRRDLNEYLAGASPLVEVDVDQGYQLTRRELLYMVVMVVYGELAHTNATQRRRWKCWAAGGLEPLIPSEFVNVVAGVAQAICWVRLVNRRALAYVRT